MRNRDLRNRRRRVRQARLLAATAAAAVALGPATAPSPAVAAPPPLGLAANNQFPFSSVRLFDPLASQPIGNVGVGGDNTWVGVAPDGDAAYAQVVYPSASFWRLDLTATGGPAAVDHVTSGGGLQYGALTPDGTTAYLSGGGSVTPVDLTGAAPSVGTPIALPNAGYLALTPDGGTAFVGVGTGVAPVALATGTVGATIPTGAGVWGIAASPDGGTIWVANSTAQTVSAVPAGGGPAVSIDLSSVGHPAQVAVSPDGARVYVTLRDEHRLAWIDAATRRLAGSVDVGMARAFALAVSPDGRTVFVSDGSFNNTGAGSQVVAVDVTSDPPAVRPPMTGFVDPVWIALTPDQPPTANFTVDSRAAGEATTFDASATVAGTTPTASYAWEFGDGTSTTTTEPTATHVYAQPGTYEATLTATDAAGTSTQRVYTGQQVLRNGGPRARATRTVVVPAVGGAQPSVALDATQLDFGTTGVRRPVGPRTVTLRNTGDAPLHVASVTLGGPGAGQFALASDACGGATVAPGASCAIRVTFAATAAGRASASLAIADDASGSPHTVQLSGLAEERGSVSGRVLDGGARGAGVAGARVQVCPRAGGGGACRTATSGRDGAFTVAGLAPGAASLQVSSPRADLFDAFATLDVQPGPNAKDVTLDPPAAPPRGIGVDGSLGTGPGGVPIVNWNDPFTLRRTVEVPYEGDPNADVLYFSYAQLTAPETSDGAPGTVGLGLMFRAVYGADGRLRGLSQAVGGRLTAVDAQTARAAANGRLAQRPLAVAARSCSGQPFGLKPSPNGGVYVDAGPLHFRLDPVAVDLDLRGSGNADLDKGLSMGVNLALNTAINTYVPGVGTYNTALAALNTISQFTSGDVARGLAQAPALLIVQLMGFGLGSKYHGATAATSGAVVGALGAFAPNPSGRACNEPRSPLPGPVNRFNIWIDPSGTVVAQGGRPLMDARVTLTRADRRAARQVAVPNGSTTMSPSNRRNPDRTTVLGAFGWDVVPGWYQVTATHPRCRAARGRGRVARTPLLEVPPPRVGLVLRMRCRGLPRRAPTRTALQAGYLRRLRSVTLRARVTARGGRRLVGSIVFRDGGRTLGSVAVDRRGRALLSANLRRGRHRLSATFAGNAVLAASRSRVVTLR